MSIIQKLLKKEAVLSLIGLGYVGLPIALAFAKKIKVIGFDIHAGRVEMMKKNTDPSHELKSSEFENADIFFTSDKEPPVGPLLTRMRTASITVKVGMTREARSARR